jgi:proline iminopeptidase
MKTRPVAPRARTSVYEKHEGYVDTGDAIVYYVTIGKGPPLVLLHGGPGCTHDYFLPYLLPLAKHRQLAQDVEAVRVALQLGRIDLLGHSFGGILAQAVAVKYPAGLRRLIIAGTGSSAACINADFAKIKKSTPKKLRERIAALEKRGIIGADGAQLPEYRRLADEAEAPYSYFVRRPPWDSAGSPMGWEVMTQVWGAKSDFHIDGNLVGFDFTEGLRQLTLPVLVIYGEHDMVSDATARESHSALANSVLLKMPGAAHMMFVDQPDAFNAAVARFLARK